MTVAQAGQSITFIGDTSGKTGTSNSFDVVPSTIDDYTVSSVSSPQTAGTAFDITIQAQDQYDNDISDGADASENITITFGLPDAGAFPTSTSTSNGKVTVPVTMTVAQAGQSITFIGDTSGKTGTSNSFDVVRAASPPSGNIVLPGENDIASYVNHDGMLKRTKVLKSYDNNAKLILEQGSYAKTALGYPLYNINIFEMSGKLPPVHEECVPISPVYDFSPDGATFEPGAMLNIDYDSSSLPEGVSEENLYIAYWDEKDNLCVGLESTVDVEHHIVSAVVEHFTAFAVVADISPAQFSVNELTINPSEIVIGESVTINCLISNIGDLTGDYELHMNINGTPIATEHLTLEGKESKRVSFVTSLDTAGSYVVDIGDMSGEIIVKATPVPAAFLISDLKVITN
jgi:hypothetical protein